MSKKIFLGSLYASFYHAGACMIMEPARIETRRSYFADYTTTPNISYNMPSFLGQNQQEYPLSFFSYIFTEKE